MKLCSPHEELSWIQTWSNSARLQRVYINHGFHESLDQGSFDLLGIRRVFSKEREEWIAMNWRDSPPRYGNNHRFRTMKTEDRDTFDSEEEVSDIVYDIGWD